MQVRTQPLVKALALSWALLAAFAVCGQEICDNGIDDDADGLADLNDTADCNCPTMGASIPSLIPNPSFEDMNCCPSSYSQVNCAQNWIQASGATSDYMNTCGIVFGAATAAGLVPFPDGNGILGTIFNNGWQEYVGSCLLQPMLASEPYIIQMNIASTPINNQGGVCNGGAINFGPIDIVIYGSTSCSNLPFSGYGCPPGSWQVIGSANYTPVSSWGTITITLTPPVDMAAIVIGSPCALPAGYNNPGGCYPYFYYDNILLNQATLFNSISQSGTWCEDNILVSTLPVAGATYQWYLNDVALPGENGLALDVSGNGYGAGNYSIMTTDTAACAIESDSVLPPVLPTADFTAPGVCLGVATQFTDNSSASSGSITAWTWDFGDGFTSAQQNPVHGYSNPGVYNVTLTITQDSICTDAITKTVTVYNLPVANFNAVENCLGGVTLFSDLSLNGTGAINAWAWDFGDGAGVSMLQNPAYYYTTISTYTVTLTVTSDSGCVSTVSYPVGVYPFPTADFSVTNVCRYDTAKYYDNSTVTPGSIAFWSWDFGDGMTSTDSNATEHLYAAPGTYAVTLIVASENNCTDTVVKPLIVHAIPTAAYTTQNECLYDTAYFTDASSVDSGNITAWNWDFGDGSLSNDQSPFNLYSQPGDYDVGLIVTSDSGCVDSVKHSIVIHPVPVAAFGTEDVCVYDPAPFWDNATVLTGNVVNWQYDFGDGVVSTLQNPTHLYAAYDTLTVRQIVTTDSGCVDTTYREVIIHPEPQVWFTADDSQGCEPFCVTFSDSSFVPGNYTVDAWDWNLGDGTGSFDQDPPVNCYYADNLYTEGVFSISLTTTSSSGCVNSVSQANMITAWPVPIAGFTYSLIPSSILYPYVTFNNTSQGGTLYYWDLADGFTYATTSDSNYTHEYSHVDTTTYVVQLITLNDWSCADTAYDSVVIDPDYIIFVPNAFSPNNDGINDFFYPRGIGFRDVQQYDLFIYDRWGDLIFHTGNIREAWDGRANDGRIAAQEDVYVWLIASQDFSGKKHKYIGRVTLIR